MSQSLEGEFHVKAPYPTGVEKEARLRFHALMLRDRHASEWIRYALDLSVRPVGGLLRICTGRPRGPLPLVFFLGTPNLTGY